MAQLDVQIRCQRCGTQMDLEPLPDGPWTPWQFWTCANCGRHFQTTYPPPKSEKPKAPPKPSKD